MLKKLDICSIKTLENLNNLSKSIEILNLLLYEFYNKSIDNLPSSIVILNISESESYNQITINNKNNIFNQRLDNLPISLQKLAIDIGIFNKNLTKLPSYITLVYSSDNEILTNAYHLVYFVDTKIIHNSKTVILELFNEVSLDFLQEGLEILKLHYDITREINDLPSSIKEIWIYRDFKKLINPIYSDRINFFSNIEFM